MRAYNTNSISYAPDEVPTDLEGIVRYLRDDRRKLQSVIAALAAGQLDETHVEPTKPRIGMIRLADGTNWNPGAGQGIYAYYGAAWHKL